MEPPFLEIPWRKPWQPISSEYAAAAEKEFHREMCDCHALFGRSVKAVGFRQDCDDVLFWLSDTSTQFAVVHLTYQRETRPEWPETTLFTTLEEWIEKGLNSDAADWIT